MGETSALTTVELLQQLEDLGDRAPMELVQALLSKGQEATSGLTRALQDREYWEAPGEKGWMPLHAVKLLASLGDPQAVPSLLQAIVLGHETDSDFVLEDLPTAFGRVGPPASEPLMEFVRGHSGNEGMVYPRAVAAAGLVAIALQHDQERERILVFLHSLFSEGEDAEFLGFVASDLLDVADPSSLPVLEEAFKGDLIAGWIVDGDDLRRARKGPDQRSQLRYREDLLAFYSPEGVAQRQAQESAEAVRKAGRREERERLIARELRRLEAVMALKWQEGWTSPSRVGRNAPCPCGSGRKFKKCCLPFGEALPPRQVLGSGRYATRSYLESAAPHDPILVLENLAALAMEAEDDGDLHRALDIFRRLEPLAERNNMLGNLLQDWEELCLDHPELGQEGLTIIRRLQVFYKGSDEEQWAYAKVDEADYLAELGQWEEGRKVYEDVLREMPGSPVIHIDYARFLERWGRVVEAAQQYERVLQGKVQAAEEDTDTAAEELRELAARHSLELAPWAREAIERCSHHGD